MTTTPKNPKPYAVVSIGRNHYVKHTVSNEFDPSVPFTSKRRAQAKCDEKNARHEARS